ncbi:MAG TPA: alpha/beta hydrolase [Actinocrinis sp.]|nr:alpha/beta hydrolase [Actinocrinis sp.]
MRVLRIGLVSCAATACLCLSLAGCSGNAPNTPSSTLSGSAAGGGAGSAREVSFSVAGTTTYGTLDVPPHAAGAHLAAALILAGSGPTDRDGNSPTLHSTPATLRLIAGILDKMGIESLRFDKYFSGKTGGGTFASDPATITYDAYARQAEAAYAFLAKQPTTDQARMLVVGHSEGGLFALQVADDATPAPVGLGLIEPADHRLLDAFTVQADEQLNALVAQGQISVATAQEQAQIAAQDVAGFRAGQSISTNGLIPQVLSFWQPLLFASANSGDVRSEDVVDPAELAARLPTGLRVLVTDGTADTNIPPSTMTPLITALQRAGIAGPGLVTLSGLDHDLHTSDMSVNDQQFAPSAVAAIQDWAQPYASAP